MFVFLGSNIGFEKWSIFEFVRLCKCQDGGVDQFTALFQYLRQLNEIIYLKNSS